MRIIISILLFTASMFAGLEMDLWVNTDAALGFSVGVFDDGFSTGVYTGAFEHDRYLGVYKGDLRDFDFGKGFGGRISGRVGIGYLMASERLAILSESRIGVYWKWFCLYVGHSSAAYWRDTTQGAGAWLFGVSFEKRLFAP